MGGGRALIGHDSFLLGRNGSSRTYLRTLWPVYVEWVVRCCHSPGSKGTEHDPRSKDGLELEIECRTDRYSANPRSGVVWSGGSTEQTTWRWWRRGDEELEVKAALEL